MTPEHVAVLSALFDGEPVDPVLLAKCLAEPDAAALLADFATLRALAQRDLGRPSDAFYASMAPILNSSRRSPLWRRVLLPALAASVLFAAAVTGFLLRPMLAPLPPPPSSVHGPHVSAASPGSEPTAGATANRLLQGASGARAAQPQGPPSATLRLRISQWQQAAPPKGGGPSE